MKLTQLVWFGFLIVLLLFRVVNDLEDGVKYLMGQVKVVSQVHSNQVAIP